MQIKNYYETSHLSKLFIFFLFQKKKKKKKKKKKINQINYILAIGWTRATFFQIQCRKQPRTSTGYHFLTNQYPILAKVPTHEPETNSPSQRKSFCGNLKEEEYGTTSVKSGTKIFPDRSGVGANLTLLIRKEEKTNTVDNYKYVFCINAKQRIDGTVMILRLRFFNCFIRGEKWVVLVIGTDLTGHWAWSETRIPSSCCGTHRKNLSKNKPNNHTSRGLRSCAGVGYSFFPYICPD